MHESTKLRWGLLATGRIAKAFAEGISHSHSGQLVAVASRSGEQARSFAAEWKVDRAHEGYEALLADPGVEAVYISTPHPMHAEWAIKACEAGKHVLCEKPLTLNHAEAMAVVEAAETHNVVLMEAFMYRCHPQTYALARLLREGEIGPIRFISATFGFAANFSPESRLFNNRLGGGGILDVGCYAVSMARLVAGAAAGLPFAEPVSVTGNGQLHPETGVDTIAAGVLTFADGVVAQVATAVRASLENTVTIIGEKGKIHLPNPFMPARNGGEWSFQVFQKGQPEPRIVSGTEERNLYAVEADVFAESVRQGKVVSPAMSPQDTLGNMRTLDRWRQALGLVYETEGNSVDIPTITRRPLAKAADAPMTYGRLPGLDKPLSRFVMGVDNQPNLSHASIMFDDFFAKGGTCFDTAYVYGGGRTEALFGQWVKNRGLRDEVVVITKGAHTPFCDPKSLTRQLLESLERQQTEFCDIYVMHRDNPDVPAGEFVDVLNQHVEAGRMRIFGGSNWSLSRIEEANAYARRTGKQGFSLLSNNISLARMVDPVWQGCISCSDTASRAWLRHHQMPVLAWSSQARGFFTERAAPDKQEDAELVRCWYAEDNFLRKARAEELAREKGVLPINIAAAYVLCQPFPTFALIGPRVLSETRTSLPALGLELTTEELAWLNLESDSR